MTNVNEKTKDVRFVVTSVRVHDDFEDSGKVACWVMGITPESERTYRIDYKVGRDGTSAWRAFRLIRTLSLELVRRNWDENNLLREYDPVMTVFDFKEYNELMNEIRELLKRDFIGITVYDNGSNETRISYDGLVRLGLGYWSYDRGVDIQLTSLSNKLKPAIEVLGAPIYTTGFYRRYTSSKVDKIYEVMSRWVRGNESIVLVINRKIMKDSTEHYTYHLVINKEEDVSGENQLSCRSVYTDGNDIRAILEAYLKGKTIPEMAVAGLS